MTPAIRSLDAAGLSYRVLRYQVGTGARLGMAAAAALGLDPACVFKTLIVEFSAERFAVVVIPVAETLDLKALGRIAGEKQAALAPARNAERLTGYVTGGISPLGQKRKLPTYVATQALSHERIYISAGRRGLELEIAPENLVRCCEARIADLIQVAAD